MQRGHASACPTSTMAPQRPSRAQHCGHLHRSSWRPWKGALRWPVVRGGDGGQAGGATGPSGVAEPGILLRGFSQAAAHSPVGVPTAALTSGRRGWTPGPRKGVNAFPANARVLEQLLPGACLPTLQTNKVFYFLYSVSLLCQHLQCPPPLHPFPWPLQSGRGGSKSLGQCSPREACHLLDTERMVKATARG